MPESAWPGTMDGTRPARAFERRFDTIEIALGLALRVAIKTGEAARLVAVEGRGGLLGRMHDIIRRTLEKGVQSA
jgi:hypothetical protein